MADFDLKFKNYYYFMLGGEYFCFFVSQEEGPN